MKSKHVLDELFISYACLEVCRDAIFQAFGILRDVYAQNGKVLLCGNGGSAADCEHIVGELMKGFKLKRPLPHDSHDKLSSFGGGEIADYLQGALPAISLVSHNALISAFTNDVGADYVFAQQVYGYGKKGDALIALSTSGNATNVVNACRVAKALEMKVIGLSGKTGGLLKNLCDTCICIPSADTASIQERHLPVYHALCAALEVEFWGSLVW
ncbi:MAG: SIS domain-containing protein [Defluviitaleaceae bacterium]|nr:SIS domain-containing protein [Defluviitaleaceae bacterium]MCL2238347.1 SIS domain-containing protein [Defluviitaleaceae bacterium]